MTNHHLRVFHASFSFVRAPGIIQQLDYENAAAKSLSLQWEAELFTGDIESVGLEKPFVRALSEKNRDLKGHRFFNFFKKIRILQRYYRMLLKQQSACDVILLRYYSYNLLQLWFLWRCKVPVGLVHHTLEVPELLLSRGVMKGKLLSFVDSFLYGYSLRQVDFIVCVTPEILAYERNRAKQPTKPGFIYPNGIFEHCPKVCKQATKKPELLFLASHFQPWHGLDLLLATLPGCDEDFVLHLVGNLTESQKKDTQSDSRIKIYGQLKKEAIIELANRCCAGISSLALFRQNMKQACTLKVREYLHMGLPVYAGYQDVLPENFPFYQQDKAEIKHILKFAKLMKNVSVEEVQLASKPFIDKEILMCQLYQNITDILVTT